MRSIGPAVTREQSPAFLRNSTGRLDLPGPYVYTVNSPAHMTKLIEFGVDAVFTDYPELMLEILNEFK